MINVCIVFVSAGSDKVEVPSNYPRPTDLWGELSEIVKEKSRVPVVGRRIHVRDSEADIGDSRG